MRIGIAINGSRGDIQPYTALGHALTAAGHEVALTANVDAAPLVAAAGLRFVPMDTLDTRWFMTSDAGQHALASGTPEALLDGANAWLTASLDGIAAGITAVAEGADAVIAGAQIDDYAAPICEALGVRLIGGYLTPWLRTAAFAQVFSAARQHAAQPRTGPENLRTYQEFERVYWRGKHDAVNTLRRSLGLPAVDASLIHTAADADLTVLHGYSPLLVPRPGDWGPRNVMTGYWRLRADVRERLGETAAVARLEDWLADGPAPVFLGFGSMPILDPAPVLEMALAAAAKAGVRILIGAGWTQLSGLADALPPDAALVGAVDHDLLFPRCLAVVHHGGAGTTAAGLIAGRPTFVFSMFMDQPFWGTRVERLRAGGRRAFRDLDVRSLTEALTLLGRPEVRRRAAAVGRLLHAEDGVATAVRAIETAVAQPTGT
ncbi:MAG TPA: glycosyltransferase [Actinocrinis sp.]|uniref:glycosyltransferase n=1 Tax=Actinocrinis sp. TaxID=1920516 RepID=UPI002DDD3EA6|nr:glycosyltransferase [Actinocrinis sp.]HEV2343645.1 glycosyltransferase [Actinocrinis sp.]